MALAYVTFRLASWYIDDAGISFAFARNVLDYGRLVHQIGTTSPVEGFSNPLWVFLNALVMGITGVRTLALTRVLGFLCLVIPLVRIYFACRRDPRWLPVHTMAYLMTILQPAVTIWSLSGLENSLLVMIGVELIILMTRSGPPSPAWFGLWVSCLALCRPDALVYLGLFPLLAVTDKQQHVGWRDMARYAVPICLLVGGYEVFRMLYFGDVLPNTYYAKAVPASVSLKSMLEIDYDIQRKVCGVLGVVLGKASFWLLLGLSVLACLHRSRLGGLGAAFRNVSLFTAMSLFCYLYLPADWMPNYRFATLFFLGAAYLVSMIVCSVFSGQMRTMVLAVILFSCLVGFWSGTERFIREKPISTEEVSSRGGYFLSWGRKLGLKRPSLLTADAGGILLDDSVKFVDLGMLCDREVARCLGELNEVPQRTRFHEYVFKTVRPDFIATRAYHSWLAALDTDERFRREYVPIHEYVDLWGLNRRNTLMMSGDYVRRDLVANRPEMLDLLVREAENFYYPFENKSIVQKKEGAEND